MALSCSGILPVQPSPLHISPALVRGRLPPSRSGTPVLAGYVGESSTNWTIDGAENIYYLVYPGEAPSGGSQTTIHKLTPSGGFTLTWVPLQYNLCPIADD